MDLVSGDILTLKIDAVNPDSGEVLFKKGTQVSVNTIEKDQVGIRFPDGITYLHALKDIPPLFDKASQGKTLSHTFKGVGTPPKALFPWMPEGSDWKKNYIWSLTISLEENGDKTLICPECTYDFGKDAPTVSLDPVYCPQCKVIVVPLDLTKG